MGFPSLTIATLGTPTGRLAGRPTRRSGAAPTRRWAALKLFPSRTIAMLATPTGRLAGHPTRRSGAAPTRRWGARTRSLWTARRSERPCSATAHGRLYMKFDIRQNIYFLAQTVGDDDGAHPANAGYTKLFLWSLWQHISPTRQIFSWCAQGDAAMAGGKGTQAHSVLSQHHYQQPAWGT